MGLVYLMQPMILAVASMVESQKKEILGETPYEQAYLISQKALNVFVKEAPVKIAMFDRDMSYIAVSKLWLIDPFFELLGTDPIGKSFKDTISSDSSKWQQIHLNCLQGTLEKREEDSWPLPDGR